MDDIKELARERVELKTWLVAYAMWSVSDKSIDQLANAEVYRIETLRRLNEVDTAIHRYVKGETA